MKFYFVRHGQSESNEQNLVSWKSAELTMIGLQQAHKTGEKLRDKNVSAICCSPLIRAQQTAAEIARTIGFGVDIKIVEELTEREVGDYARKSRPKPKNFFYEEVDDASVESVASMIERARAALDRVSELSAGSEGEVLVVGHAVIGFYMRQITAGHDHIGRFDWSLKLNNAEVVELEYEI